MEVTNAARAEWAAAALRTFIAITGSDWEDSLCDLLADLMHWADKNQYDFAAALARAERHYEVEQQEEGD